jgi:hypothetical protein
MIKVMVSLALLLAGVAAHAETINLDTSACGATRYCTAVYNDATPAAGITIAANPSSPAVTVYIDGVAYSSPGGNAPDTLNTPVAIVELTLTNDAGEAIVLNATFYGKRVLHRSGHNYWTRQWTLLDGTIAR